MHVGFVEFVTTAAYVIVFTFLWRALAAALVRRDNATAQTIGRALAAVYS